MNLRWNGVHRRYCCGAAAAVGFAALTLAMSPASMIEAQTQEQPAATQAAGSFPYQGFVIEDDLYVRCGGGDAFYPFGKLKRGDVVTVTDERYGWARVQTAGRAFRDMFGYIRADDVRADAAAGTGLTLGRVSVFAPNAYRDLAPEASWRPIGDISPERTVTILGTVTSGADGYHKIELPGSCEGWVAARYLRRATVEEVTAWTASSERAEITAAQATHSQQPSTTEKSRDSVVPQQGAAAKPGSTTTRDSAQPVLDHTVSESFIERIDEATDPAAAKENEGGEGSSIVAANEPTDLNVVDMPDLQEEEGEQSVTTTMPTAAQGKPGSLSTIPSLEAAYEAIKNVPIRAAEIDTLRDQYASAIASGALDRKEVPLADARVQMLDARLELQKQLNKLDEARDRAGRSSGTFDAAWSNIEAATEYTAVGRLNVSTIFDGERLPRLLRVTDTGSGRTVAYLVPEGKFDDPTVIDQVIGVVGEKRYDESLRLTVIHPTRIDLLGTTRTVRVRD